MEKNLALKLFAILRKSPKGETLTDAQVRKLTGLDQMDIDIAASSWRRKVCSPSSGRTRSWKTEPSGKCHLTHRFGESLYTRPGIVPADQATVPTTFMPWRS